METILYSYNNNNNNNTQLVTRHMSVNAYSYLYERTESQARTGGLSVTVGFIVQMSFKLFFEGLLAVLLDSTSITNHHMLSDLSTVGSIIR